ncbi:MAG: hypothetical protein QXN16_00090 [Candidatus Micrarchaeaceae archaeon]
MSKTIPIAFGKTPSGSDFVGISDILDAEAYAELTSMPKNAMKIKIADKYNILGIYSISYLLRKI